MSQYSGWKSPGTYIMTIGSWYNAPREITFLIVSVPGEDTCQYYVLWCLYTGIESGYLEDGKWFHRYYGGIPLSSVYIHWFVYFSGMQVRKIFISICIFPRGHWGHSSHPPYQILRLIWAYCKYHNASDTRLNPCTGDLLTETWAVGRVVNISL
jgi:hypothetical protein